MTEALRTGPYGRCVYRCDNNVCDHMSILMEFDNGVTDGARQIVVRKHVSSQAETFEERVINVRTNGSGHGGGDAGIMEDFITSLIADSESRSSISHSVESHLMACAIEQARLTGMVADMAEYRKNLT